MHVNAQDIDDHKKAMESQHEESDDEEHEVLVAQQYGLTEAELDAVRQEFKTLDTVSRRPVLIRGVDLLLGSALLKVPPIHHDVTIERDIGARNRYVYDLDHRCPVSPVPSCVSSRRRVQEWCLSGRWRMR